MARRSLESVCLRASRTCRSLSWLDWSIQSPLFEPGSVGGVRAGAEAIKPSFFFSRISLYFFTSIERMPLYHARTGSIRYVKTYQFSTTTEAVQRQGPSRLRRHTAGVRYPRLQRAIPRSAFSVPLPALFHPECRIAVSSGG